MNRLLEAYRVKVVTSKNVEDGATKGGILWLHSPVEDQEGYFYFVSSPDSDVGIPLAVGQVEREKEWDKWRIEETQGTETPVPPAVESVPVSVPTFAAPVEQPTFVMPTNPMQENPRGKGLKHDAGKVRPSLLIEGMPRALLRVADVLTFGAEKYEAHSWQHVENGRERYTDAKLRHMFAEAKGEPADAESHIEHLAHEICNSLFLLEKLLRTKENAA